MSRTFRFAAAAVLLAAPLAAHGQVLDFEGIGAPPAGFTPIGNFYNGGGGPNFGIEFSSNALAICLDVPGRDCNNVSRGGQGDPGSQNTGLFFLEGGQTFMNRAAGFTDGFSFFYSAVNNAGSFSVYDGLNGTGNVLATLALPTTPNGAGNPACLGNNFCPFFAAGVNFTGTARSVSFAGVGNQIVFDDVTFGSSTPGQVIPEPSTYAMLAAGLAGVAAVARRRRSA
jgi:hypothetical protein